MIADMKQFKSQDGEIIIIDMALNIFLYGNNSEDLPHFAQNILLKTEWIQKLQQVIIENQAKNPNCTIGVDMSYISACLESRAFENFAKGIEHGENVFFFGLVPQSTFCERIISDMTTDSQTPFYDNETGFVFVSKPSLTRRQKNIKAKKIPERIIRDEISGIVRGLIDNRPNYELLCSSSIYANKYIDIKALFMNPAELRLILFYLAKKITSDNREYDALVATSKNGSVLAELLGQLLGKDSAHCISVGPQFSVSAQTLNNALKSGKKYVYVGDFICLGTEVKLLQVLIADRGATLVGGVSVASYIQLDNCELRAQNSPLCLISALINLIEEHIPFDICIHKQKD